MKVLVTGACGFVGRHLVAELASNGLEVVAAVLTDPVPPAVLERASSVVHLDVCDQGATREAVLSFEPDAVFHLAGIAFAPAAAKNYSQALAVNVGGTFSVCSALSELGARRPFVLASSGEVYGKVAEESLPITEAHVPAPYNPYSVTKLQAEEVVNYFARLGKITPYLMRPFNHIGPGQSAEFVCASFASQLAEIALGQHEPAIQVGNLEAERDFMDVRDVVRAYRLILGAPEGIYNVSSGTSVKIDDLLHILLDVSGLDVEIQPDPNRMRPAEVKEVRGSFDKLYKTIGWKPEIDIETSLRDIYSYWYALKSGRDYKHQ